MTIEYREIEVGSDLHASEHALRLDVLRRPLGRDIDAEEAARDRAGAHYCAVDGDRVVACAGFYPEAPGVVRLRHMAVAPELQGGGVGAALLRHAEDAVRAAGARRVETHARCTARGFYARMGYAETGEEFPEHGIPHILMWKTL